MPVQKDFQRQDDVAHTTVIDQDFSFLISIAALVLQIFMLQKAAMKKNTSTATPSAQSLKGLIQNCLKLVYILLHQLLAHSC